MSSSVKKTVKNEREIEYKHFECTSLSKINSHNVNIIIGTNAFEQKEKRNPNNTYQKIVVAHESKVYRVYHPLDINSCYTWHVKELHHVEFKRFSMEFSQQKMAASKSFVYMPHLVELAGLSTKISDYTCNASPW